ncbi:MAG TPA: metal-sulfur cluster assembly factor [Chloroflexota bacterium]|jgi:metal-sulfur cluster biosynthetic enzyme|nr:metal-sulfur cluster assembly factor [Chloroflexota bacterium]
MPALLINEAAVLEALKEVIDPELGINVVDLGLIYDIAIDGSDVLITMTLTTPGCPLHESIAEAVDEVVRLMVPGAGAVEVELVWDPPWTPDRISEQGRLELGWRA